MKPTVVILASYLLLAGCGTADDQSNMMNIDEPGTSMNETERDALREALTDPNYAEEEDGIYSYISAVSEEDKKQGKAAGNVIRFAFRGIKDGRYVVSLVDDDGKTLTDSECSKPCRVIKTQLGDEVVRQEYTPESMIGAAFQDALSGKLKVTPERQLGARRLRAETAPDETRGVPLEDTTDTDYEPPMDSASSRE